MAMTPLSVHLAAVSLLCLTPVITGLNFKVAVVVEQNAVNISLIDLTVNRRVNSNWRLLPGHSMSHVTVQVSVNGGQQAARDVCSQIDLSALLTIGSCGLASEMSSLAMSLKLPFIALPTALCDPMPAGYGAVGSHAVTDFVDAAVAAMASKDADQVIIFYDTTHGGPILTKLQSGLSSIGVSSITFNAQVANESQLGDLSEKLRHLMKKRVFNAIVMAMPHNAVNIVAAAANASVMQQNYFWLIIDSGLSKAQLMTVCPINCNLALLRGGTTGVNEAGHCPTAVRDVFEECDTDHIRTLDVRLVDAIEALAMALTNSVMQPRFQPSNASCFPLQSWSSGPDVLNNLISLSNYDSDRGVISYNSTTRFFNAQGVEIVASFTEQLSSPVRFVLSAQFINNALMKLFRKRDGASFVFPNTFTGFGNATLIICTPLMDPTTIAVQTFPNGTVIIEGMVREILDYLADGLEFRYIAKPPDDGEWGAPIDGSDVFSGCVGELQRGLVQMAAGPFTKTSTRDSVIDFSSELFQESNAMLVPKPKPQSKWWDAFLPLHWSVWLVLIGSIFIAAFAVWILAFLSPFSAINLGLEGALSDEGSYLEYAWTIIGSFMLQGQDFYPYAISPRIALVFWWCFTVIIYSAYTAFLASTLTVTTTATAFQPIKTLADLVSQTAIIPAAEIGTNVHTLLKTATTGVYKQIGDRLLDTDGDCAYLPMNKSVACFNDFTYLTYISRMYCDKVYIAEETFNTGTVAFMYQEDSHFADNVNFLIRKMRENGQMQRLFEKYYQSESDVVCLKSDSQASSADAIGLDTTAGCFIVTGALFALGFLLLSAELLLKLIRRRFRGPSNSMAVNDRQ